MAAFVPAMPLGTLNVALSNFIKSYLNGNMIASQLAPSVPVARQAFQYVVFDRSSQRNDRQTLRAPGDRPQSVRMNYSAAPYFCKSHALEGNIPFESEQYALGLGFSEEQSIVAFLKTRLDLDREVTLGAMATNPALVPNNQTLSGASMWDSYQNSTPLVSHPIPVVQAAKDLIKQSGVAANTFFLSPPVVSALRNHPDILARFVYTNGQGNVDLDFLSKVFGVTCVEAPAIVLDKNDIASWVWGTSAVLAYVQPVTSQYDLSAFKTFDWEAAPGTSGGYGVLQFPDPYLNKKASISSADWYWDMRMTAPETLFTFNGCVQTPVMGAVPAPVFG